MKQVVCPARRLLISALLMLSLIAAGCGLSAGLQMLASTNPVLFVLTPFLKPVFDELEKTLLSYGEKLAAELPEEVQPYLSQVIETGKKIQEFQAKLANLRELRSEPVKLLAEINAQIGSKDNELARILEAYGEQQEKLREKPAELAKYKEAFHKERAGLLSQINQLKEQKVRQGALIQDKDAEIARLRAELEKSRGTFDHSNRRLQEKMLIAERETGFVTEKHEELLVKINEADGIRRSPLAFVKGGPWNSEQGYVDRVIIKEEEFQKVAWHKVVQNNFKDWDDSIKPVEVAMQQRMLYTALVMKELPREFDLMKREIREETAREGENYRFNITRKN